MALPKPGERAIFNDARRIEVPDARRRYLEQACGEDRDLQARVEALLRVHDEDQTFLRSPAEGVGAGFADPVREAPGTVIGPYKLLEPIGEGGFGVVFLADQAQPVKRRVALKIIKPGMDSRQVLARFEAERQALALMDHPNIAKVLDAGETPPAYAGGSPRPYFVMELVQGAPITRYCDEHQLTPRQRLELFVPVCQGVQHAHQKGVIHRDLKPSNVLVALYDGKPVPKIIDFGVAKATGQKLTEQTLVTQLGLIIGTPEYMSPEQAEPNQLDIDTRSDIYSLGVLLYELLTGTTPLQRERMEGAGLLGLLRMIRDEEPPRPSTRLDTTEELPSIAAKRGVEPKKLRGLVRGELDWIVMKCLEKDRARRYETADGLARDLERYLRDEPVEASPPGAGYRLRKFARRHRKTLATAAAFALLLLGGGAVSAWQAVRATAAERRALAERDDKEKALQAEAEQHRQAVEEKQRADEEAAIATAVNDFLRKDLLGQADIANQAAGTERNSNITVRELLDRAAEKVDEKFRGQERTEAAIRLTLGKAYLALGEYPEAQKHLERSLALRRSGSRPLETLDSSNMLGVLHLHCGRYAEAEPLLVESLEGQRARRGTDHPDTLRAMGNLAWLYKERGRYAEAEPLFRESLEGLRVSQGPDHRDTLAAMSNLASLYKERGQTQKAAPLYKQVEEGLRAKLGEDHPDTLTAANHLGRFYREQGRHREAEPLLKQVLDVRRLKLGPGHPGTLRSMGDLGALAMEQGRYPEAEPLLKEALAGLRARLGDDDLETLDVMNSLGVLYLHLRRCDEAERLFRHVIARWRVKLGADHRLTLTAVSNLAAAYQLRGRHDEAGPLLEQVMERFRAQLSGDHPLLLRHLSSLGKHYQHRGRHDKAELLFDEALATCRAKLPAAHPITLLVMNDLAALYWEQRRYDKAEPLFREVLDVRRAGLPAGHPDLLMSMNNLARLYYDRGRYDKAESLYREAAAGATKRFGLGDPRTQRYVNSLIELYGKQGKPQLAEPELRELANFSRDKDGPDSLAYAGQLARLAHNLLEQKKSAEAEPVARDCLTIRAKRESDAWTTFYAQWLLGGALLAQKEYAEAEPFLVQGYAGLKEREAKLPKHIREQLTQDLEWLVHLHDARGNKAEADRLRKEWADAKARQKR